MGFRNIELKEEARHRQVSLMMFTALKGGGIRLMNN